MSYKGVNYGKVDLEGSALTLTTMAGTSSIFSINYSAINNSTMNKNDIIIEAGAD